MNTIIPSGWCAFHLLRGFAIGARCICGACHTCHHAEGDGIRALTPAEMLALHIEVPRTLGMIQAGECDPTGNQVGRSPRAAL